jgi:predicted RNA binding protein YcfA (HicA-like mRNA interferase family)
MIRLSGKEFCKVMERHGWTLARIRGSHHIYTRPGAPRPVPLPVHGNTTLDIGLQRQIMREAGLTEDDL